VQLKVYLIGSLRNPEVPKLGEVLRGRGFDCFDDWYAAGPEADDYWQRYEQAKGHTFAQALAGKAAQNVFTFDKRNLDASDAGVLVLPAGKSGHLELGYLIGRGRPGFILMQGEPERYDVMYNFASGVFTDVADLVKALCECSPTRTSAGSPPPPMPSGLPEWAERLRTAYLRQLEVQRQGQKLREQEYARSRGPSRPLDGSVALLHQATPTSPSTAWSDDSRSAGLHYSLSTTESTGSPQSESSESPCSSPTQRMQNS
jgi:hypothetical protein